MGDCETRHILTGYLSFFMSWLGGGVRCVLMIWWCHGDELIQEDIGG